MMNSTFSGIVFCACKMQSVLRSSKGPDLPDETNKRKAAVPNKESVPPD